MNFLTTLIPLIIPFLYTSIGGLRVAIIIPVILILTLATQKKWQIKNKKILLIQSLMLVLMVSYALLTGYYDNLFAFLIFFILSIFLSLKSFNDDELMKLMKIYVLMGMFSAVGLIIQYFTYSILGVTFGTVILFNNRTAFSFLWLDFSFFSLYLASLVPLIFFVFKKNYIKLLLSLVVLIASFITTARTGVFAFFLFFTFYILYHAYQIFLTGRLSLNNTKIIFSILLISPLVLLGIPYIQSLSNREITASDSGRTEGYLSALNYVENNLFFGYMFDSDNYFNNINVLPHNSILYILTMGGIVFLLLFCIFLTLIFFYSKNKFILSSILISLIGTMFIPSFYSMYYLGFLISASLAYYNLSTRNN